MQQNVRLITFPIFIFTTITNLAESCPWKKAILRPLGMVSRKKVAVLLDFVQITSTPPSPSPQFGQLVQLFPASKFKFSVIPARTGSVVLLGHFFDGPDDSPEFRRNRTKIKGSCPSNASMAKNGQKQG